LKRRSLTFFLVFCLVAFCVLAVVGVQMRSKAQLRAEVRPLFERQLSLHTLGLELERFRFDVSLKKTPSDMLGLRDALKSQFEMELEHLDRLSPSLKEVEDQRELKARLQDWMQLLARQESTPFVKDPYQRLDIHEGHEQLLHRIGLLKRLNDGRLKEVVATQEDKKHVLVIGVLLLVLIGMMASVLLRLLVFYQAPLERLLSRTARLREDPFAVLGTNGKAFQGNFEKLYLTIEKLSSLLTEQVRDRHKFVSDLVNDLKPPLEWLKKGNLMLLRGNIQPELPGIEQAEAADAARRGLSVLGGCLDDLIDLTEMNRMDTKLEEQTVDLAELIREVIHMLCSPKEAETMALQVPAMPVWVQIDPHRFKRMLVQILMKLRDGLKPDAGLLIQLSADHQAHPWAVELSIQDKSRGLDAGRRPKYGGLGPEQDLRLHWLSDKGLLIQLAQKIMTSHGGMVRVSGTASQSVRVVIRLPFQRVVQRGLLSRPGSKEHSIEVTGLEA
jgi:signal transduction histidine kinase